jgi:hypothetical protein
MPVNLEVNTIEQILTEIKSIQQTGLLDTSQSKNIKNYKESSPNFPPFVDPSRMSELKGLKSTKYDLSKLIRYCEELDNNFRAECFLSVPMLGRAILDHVPPIFGCKSFSEVANNYAGTKSFKQSMEHLENSLRKIADAHLHVQIRKSEVLPNRTQVNYSADLDVLLAEIVRLLKRENDT